MKLSFGLYLLLLATCSCHAQLDSDLFALFYSRRSSGDASAPVSSSSSRDSLFFGNISEELERMKALQTELQTVRNALDVYSTTIHNSNSDDNASRRRVKSAKKYSKKHAKKYAKNHAITSKTISGELEKCQAELAKHENEVSFLFIQTASECQVQRSTDSDGETTSYKLVTDTISEDTYAFSDRPYRFEGIISTADLSAEWSNVFNSSNPNVGVTLVSDNDDDDQAVGPLVAVFSEPDYQGNGQLAYTIEQSPNQDSVLSIESIFDGASLDSVSFESCSFFIDGNSTKHGWKFIHSMASDTCKTCSKTPTRKPTRNPTKNGIDHKGLQ